MIDNKLKLVFDPHKDSESDEDFYIAVCRRHVRREAPPHRLPTLATARPRASWSVYDLDPLADDGGA